MVGHKANLDGLHKKVDEFVAKVNEATQCVSNDIAALQKYRTQLESYAHLGDIDAIWSDVEGHKTNLNDLHKQVDEFVAKVDETTRRINNDIAALQKYRAQLESFVHLGDIDAIWSDVEGHKTNLDGLHKQVDLFVKETHDVEKSIRASIEVFSNFQREKNFQIDKKLKIAYGIAGSSVLLSLVHLILQLLGVL